MGGRAFGSITSKEIAQAAQEQLGLTLDKKKIILKDPIKPAGVQQIQIRLHPQVMGELKLTVTEEK